jgi:hypothetical protein
MTNVIITEIKTGRVVAFYPTIVHGANFTPGENDYIETAWESAVDDKMVDANSKADYSFDLKDAPLRLQAMADHVFPKPDDRCLVCGVHAKDAHRVACVDRRTIDVAKASNKPKATKGRPAGGRGKPRPSTKPCQTSPVNATYL